jgi:hypothetical protein
MVRLRSAQIGEKMPNFCQPLFQRIALCSRLVIVTGPVWYFIPWTLTRLNSLLGNTVYLKHFSVPFGNTWLVILGPSATA